VQCARALERDAYLRDQLRREEIADWIMVNEPTVRAHVSRILGKLHLAGRTQAALYAVREGLADADSAQEEQATGCDVLRGTCTLNVVL
jgi:NarL family two-component system response regulator LiaR